MSRVNLSRLSWSLRIKAGGAFCLKPGCLLLLLLVGQMAQLVSFGQVGTNNSGPGSVDLTFDARAAASGIRVQRIHVQSDGRILVANDQAEINGVLGTAILRLKADGTQDNTFKPQGYGISGVDRNGRLFSQSGTNLVRLNPDGTLDVTFRPCPLLNPPQADPYFPLAVEMPDYTIVVAVVKLGPSGFGIEVQRLLGDGTVDPSFLVKFGYQRGFIPALSCLLGRADGSVAIVGGFSPWSLQVFKSNGEEDPRFSRTEVLAVAEQIDGKLLVAGNSGFGLERINVDGSTDAAFQPDLSLVDLSWPDGGAAIALQNDGKILLGGPVGDPRSKHTGICRLNEDGTLDRSFNVGIGLRDPSFISPLIDYSSLNAISVQNDGMLLIGGNFTSVDGVARQHLARLTGTTQAMLIGPKYGSETFSVAVQTLASQQYAIEYATELAGPNWIALPAVQGTGAIVSLKDTNAVSSQRFYRVRIE